MNDKKCEYFVVNIKSPISHVDIEYPIFDIDEKGNPRMTTIQKDSGHTNYSIININGAKKE